MKPKHSHDLQVGDILRGERPCGCVWVYVKFYPPTFRLVEKCRGCQESASIEAEMQAQHEIEMFGEFANPSLTYYLIYGANQVVHDSQLQNIVYYTSDAERISEQLPENTRVLLKKMPRIS